MIKGFFLSLITLCLFKHSSNITTHYLEPIHDSTNPRILQTKVTIKSQKMVQCEEDCRFVKVIHLQQCMQKCKNIPEGDDISPVLILFFKIFIGPITLLILCIVFLLVKKMKKSTTQKYCELLRKTRKQKNILVSGGKNFFKSHKFIRNFNKNLYKQRFLNNFKMEKLGEAIKVYGEAKFGYSETNQVVFYIIAKQKTNKWCGQGSLIETQGGLHLWFISQSLDTGEESGNVFTFFQSTRIDIEMGIMGVWEQREGNKKTYHGTWSLLFSQSQQETNKNQSISHAKLSKQSSHLEHHQ